MQVIIIIIIMISSQASGAAPRAAQDAGSSGSGVVRNERAERIRCCERGLAASWIADITRPDTAKDYESDQTSEESRGAVKGPRFPAFRR